MNDGVKGLKILSNGFVNFKNPHKNWEPSWNIFIATLPTSVHINNSKNIVIM